MDDELIFTSNLIIAGNLVIKNGSLIVAGNLEIYGYVEIENGHLIVSGTLETYNFKPFDVKGDISAERLHIESSSLHIDGDIWVNKNSYIYSDLTCNDFTVLRNSSCGGNIHCLNCLIDGNNESCNIEAEEDIYILGSSNSFELTGRDIFIAKDAEFNNKKLNIVRSAYIGGKITHCSSLNVGN